ncbi:MAG: hypothetical protein ACRC1F_00385 [Metamycoplasmataceae bacterium]
MKKLLLTLSISVPILLPMTLISCSQNSVQDRIDKAQEKIDQIVSSKPLPTLRIQPGDKIELENYFQTNAFVSPTTDISGVKIEMSSIELPVPNSTDFNIWLKVTSTDTLDIAAEISDFYSVKFSDLNGIDKTKIEPISSEKLKTPFSILIQSMSVDLGRFVNDALSGTRFFNGQESIDPNTLINDPKKLLDRLTSDNIDKNVFDGRQKNVHVSFVNYFENSKRMNLNFELREKDATAEVIVDLTFDVIGGTF